MAKKKSEHYVNNKQLLEEIVVYRKKYLDNKEKGLGKPLISNYLGECFLKIATHLSYKPNFVNYMFREDMISDGIENCIQYIHNFDPKKSTNPFAYFTQIIHYAFLRRIQKEKRQLEIKNKIIEKTEDGYSKIQQACLFGRRNGTIPYWQIADNSRSFYQVRSFQDLSNASKSFAYTYKRDFWAESADAVEVWLEKEALAGVVSPVTNEYRIRLVPTRGFASETIVHNAIKDAKAEGRSRLFVKTLYDFDRSGEDAEAAIVRRMNEIGQTMGIEVIHPPSCSVKKITVLLLTYCTNSKAGLSWLSLFCLGCLRSPA